MATTSNGSNAKAKKTIEKPVEASASQTADTTDASPSSIEIVKLAGGKPDINHHHAQLDLIKAEIDKTTSELVSILIDL